MLGQSFIDASSPFTCESVRDLGLTINDLESFENAWNVASNCPGVQIPAVVFIGGDIPLPPTTIPDPLPTSGGVPVFYKNGVPVTSVNVGDTVTFDIAGFAQIWLYQLKNGAVQYNGPFTLPMAPYQMTAADVGHFETYAYELVGGTYGNLIGYTTMDVVGSGAGGGSLDTSNLLLYGGIALVAFMLLKR